MAEETSTDKPRGRPANGPYKLTVVNKPSWPEPDEPHADEFWKPLVKFALEVRNTPEFQRRLAERLRRKEKQDG